MEHAIRTAPADAQNVMEDFIAEHTHTSLRPMANVP